MSHLPCCLSQYLLPCEQFAKWYLIMQLQLQDSFMMLSISSINLLFTFSQKLITLNLNLSFDETKLVSGLNAHILIYLS